MQKRERIFEDLKAAYPEGPSSLNANSVTQVIENLAKKHGFSRRTGFYGYDAWLEWWAITHPESAQPSEFNILQQLKKDPENLSKLIDVLGAEKANKSKKPKSKKKKGATRLDSSIDFFTFCEKYSWPPYSGLYEWQKELHRELWDSKYNVFYNNYSETLVPRDHGKSVYHMNLPEWLMSCHNWDVLYTGWTDRRKQIARDIYQFFFIRKELSEGKANSDYHFSTTYGTKFDTYSTMSKEMLGMHEVGKLDREIDEDNDYLRDYVRDSSRRLLLIMDDPIDDKFLKERYREEELETRFLSTILNINPDMLMVVGTRKFEGDFYDFFKNTFKDKMTLFVRKPFLQKSDPRYNKDLKNNPMNLLCPERWTVPGQPNYKRDIRTKAKKDLLARKQDLLNTKPYWWYAEYEQNPHPITGTVFNMATFIPGLQSTHEYDLVAINIDRATTQKETSDFTGITCEIREKGGRRVVFDDLTQKIDIMDLVDLIDKLWEDYHNLFPTVEEWRINIEKQGGGDDWVDLVIKLGKPYGRELIMDKKGRITQSGVIYRIHSSRDKLSKIEDYLKYPVNNGELVFISALRNSDVANQLDQFPNAPYIDALDSLAMGDFEIRKEEVISVDYEALAYQLSDYRKAVEERMEEQYNSLPMLNKGVTNKSIFN